MKRPSAKMPPFPPCGGRMRSLGERSEPRRSWMGGSAARAARARESATSRDCDAAELNDMLLLGLADRQRCRAARLSARTPHPAPAKLGWRLAKPAHPSPARGEGFCLLADTAHAIALPRGGGGRVFVCGGC